MIFYLGKKALTWVNGVLIGSNPLKELFGVGFNGRVYYTHEFRRRNFEFLWVRNGKICHLWAKPSHWYRYRKWVQVPIGQRQSGTGTYQSGTGTHSPVKDWYRYRSKWYQYQSFQQPCFCSPYTVKSRIRTPII